MRRLILVLFLITGAALLVWGAPRTSAPPAPPRPPANDVGAALADEGSVALPPVNALPFVLGEGPAADAPSSEGPGPRMVCARVVDHLGQPVVDFGIRAGWSEFT
jgi:hypothetical protein